ncbi:carboxypeptidase-like regulatory domain-containing protein [Flavobacterium selenitireducens]|uniref:carboxypeptidase-like regulatory domain-containing protein n=1 Tax=Flavobacterium selenitireducens TaxID=2722704 RepID=UPI00168B3832|nr:carboxypeptidase-like regulatory domain-containing protein [Flavobacterium selenitireducens]MBD3582005.1 carboxypeptidase-like regulatory domain-containing protein [Flavobacterium selenitireducens]
MKNIYIVLIALVCAQVANAQIRGKVVDAKSGESIPYANILINNSDSQISNGEGYFTVSAANSSDDTPIVISCMGYAGIKTTVGQLQSRDGMVRLDEVTYELDNVNLADRPTAESIMAGVKQNLKANYAMNMKHSKDVLFLRDVVSFKPSKLNFEITKSTGFTKKGLGEANAEISKFTSSLISHPPKEFTDMLGNYYTSPKKEAEKQTFYSKLDVVQATKLKDENRSASLDEMQAVVSKLFLKHLDTTKYYRFKSGWFGSRDTLSMRKDYNSKKKKKNKVDNVSLAKNRLSSLKNQSNFLYSKKMEFVTDPDIYKYTYEGTVLLGGNEFAYVLKFEPRRSRAIYQGKIYVSESDFAVLRADYALAPGKKAESVNLKLLLGVKMAENISSGTLIFKKDPIGDGYYLQYASEETGQYFYLNRPLKFIELTDEEKDVVAFDLKVEGNMLSKQEFLNISRDGLSDEEFDKVKEDDFAYKRINKYDPTLWKNYSAIEPLDEMKRFQVIEETN